jgi:serine kinase of HPr protein (carbohydrate metabolism regulator)
MSEILHAGLIALRSGGRWRGALVFGPSGSGKSDLALRAMDLGFRLVADDRTLVWTSGGRLFGRAPDVLRGKLEIRGAGIVRLTCLDLCRIDLAVTAGEPERMPDREALSVLGQDAPRLRLRLTEASAPHRIADALCRLGADREESYQDGLPAPAAPVQGENSP